MFKKSVAAIAVLGAMAGTAMAANVTLYGVIDTSLMYTYHDVANPEEAHLGYDGKTYNEQSNLSMESGVNSGSRFGLKGVEELGNGMKIGFKLENGFNSDNGTLGQGSRLFGREASLSLYTDLGTLSFGRMGAVGSSCGTYDLVYSIADAFDGLDNNVGGLAISDRYDNMITYQSPKIAGVQATVQYSFKQDSKADGTEGKASADRYAGGALTGEWGNLNTVLAYEYTDRANPTDLANKLVRKDSQVVYLGGNYDCGFAKTFVMAQYFEGLNSVAGFNLVDDGDGLLEGEDGIKAKGMKGYGLHVGTVFPALGGDVTLGLYYVDGKIEAVKYGSDDAEDYDVQYLGGAARYEYSLSKRTSVYGGAGVAQAKIKDYDDGGNYKDFIGQAYLGLVHRF